MLICLILLEYIKQPQSNTKGIDNIKNITKNASSSPSKFVGGAP